MTHCFYAGMGGFVIDPEDYQDVDSQPFMPKQTRLTLTPRGVRLLAECNLLPDISEAEILDKSKTDGVGKTLAIIQGGWMVVQVATRLLARLPVTILEVNTIGHVLCAFIIYLLWWYKPKWVQDPTRLHGEWVRPLAAFMYMSSQMSDLDKQEHSFLRDFGASPELSRVAYATAKTQDGVESQENVPEGPESLLSGCQHTSSPAACSPLSHDPSIQTEPSPIAEQGNFVPLQICPTCYPKGKGADAERALAPQKMDRTSLMRWQLASTAVQSFHGIRQRMTKHSSPASKKYREALRLYPEMPDRIKRQHKRRAKSDCHSDNTLECDVEQLVTTYASNWPADDLLRGMPGILIGATLWLASIGYGLVHLAAWASHFASATEAWLWRSSALDIAGSGLVCITINILAGISQKIWWYWYDALAGGISRIGYMVLGSLGAIGGLLYVVARCYLVVEAFVSLRSLPIGAYLSPSWVLIVPHF